MATFHRDDIVVTPEDDPDRVRRWRRRQSLMVVASAVAMMMGAVAGNVVARRLGPAGAGFAPSMGTIAGAVAGILAFASARWAWSRLRRGAHERRHADALERMLQPGQDARAREFLRHSMLLVRIGGHPGNAARLVEAVRAAGPCIAIVSASNAAAVSAIAPLPGAVEPEELPASTLTRSRWTVRRAATLAACLGLLLLFAWAGRAQAATVVIATIGTAAVMFAVMLAASALFFRRAPSLGRIMVGQGWAEHGGRRWSSADSILLVLPSQVEGRVGLMALDPHGALSFPVASVDSPAFRTLWTRWTHAEPRPEQPTWAA